MKTRTCEHCGGRIIDKVIVGDGTTVALDGRVFERLPYRELKRATGQRRCIVIYRDVATMQNQCEPVAVDSQPSYKFRRPHNAVCVARQAA